MSGDKTGSLSGRAHERLLEHRPGDYVALAVLGVLPTVISPIIGIAESRSFSDPSLTAYGAELAALCAKTESLSGFAIRKHWTIYAAALPVALWVYREVLAACLGVPTRWEEEGHTSDYSPFVGKFAAIRQASTSVVLAGIVTIMLVVIGEMMTIVRYAHTPTACPNDVDWGWYSLVFADVSHWHVIPFNIYTSIFLQGTIVFLGILLAMDIMLYNVAFIAVIHSGGPGSEQGQYVLKLSDPEKRFGLKGLAPAFRAQLTVVTVTAGLMIFGRYANEDLIHGLVIDFQSWTFNIDLHFGDVGQTIIFLCWSGFFLIVQLPCLVKFKPLLARGSRSKRGLAYVKAFSPTENLPDDARTAFQDSHIWPMGNKMAGTYMFACVAMGILFSFPTELTLANLVTVAGTSFVLVSALFVSLGWLVKLLTE